MKDMQFPPMPTQLSEEEDDFTPQQHMNLRLDDGPVFITAENLDRALTRIAKLEAGIAAIRTHACGKCLHHEMQTDLCLESIEEICDELAKED